MPWVKSKDAVRLFYLAAEDSAVFFWIMRNLFRGLFLGVVLFSVTVAFGGTPPVNVTVSNAGGKAAFKGVTDSKGVFTTANVPPGNYTVQFVSNSGEMKGKTYAVVVSAGKKKVSSGGVAGEKFAKGGVAMKVDAGPGVNISGQVAAETSSNMSKNGKKMVWIPPQLGSHQSGHWAEEDSAEAKAARSSGSLSSSDVRNMQDRGRSPGQ
jgi:hypothetical protein